MSHIDEGILHAYLDGEVSEGQKAEIETHLSACGECSDRLEAAKQLIGRASGLLAELEPGVAQPPAWPEIEERAAARAAETARRPFVRPWLAWAASIVLAFGVGWLSSSNWPEWGDRSLSPPREVLTPTAVSSELPSVRSETTADMDAAQEPGIVDAPAEMEAMPSIVSATRGDAEPQPASPRPEEQRDKAEADQEGFVDETQEREADASARRREAALEEAPAEPVIAAYEVSRIAGDERQNEFAERKQGDAPDAELALPMAQVTAEGAAQAATPASLFFAVQPEEAAAWLGVELRTLPDLELQRIEVGPGNALQGGLEGLPAVRLVYQDAADHEIELIQQRVSAGQALDAYATEPVLAVDPSGRNVYRWWDRQGYLLTLAASVSGDSLRALAERIR